MKCQEVALYGNALGRRDAGMFGVADVLAEHREPTDHRHPSLAMLAAGTQPVLGTHTLLP
jgi:hypothetical protein